MSESTQTNRLKLRLELLWWCFTAILAGAVLAPIWLNGVDYPFYGMNAVYIVLFVTFARYIFLLKHTWLARRTWVKVGLIALSAILVFVLIGTLGDFNNYLDEKGLQTLVDHLPLKKRLPLMHYIQSQLIFFGVGSVICAVMMPIRMIISVWRTHNTDSKV